jgi:hypothetical protein
VKIKIPSEEELNGPRVDPKTGARRMSGLCVALEDCEIVDDDGKVITTEVMAIDIRMRCGEPVTATIERFDVSGEIRALEVGPGQRDYDLWNKGIMAGLVMARMVCEQQNGQGDKAYDGGVDDCLRAINGQMQEHIRMHGNKEGEFKP